MSNKSFQDKDKPVQVRQSNIIAAKGTGLYRTGISFSVLTRDDFFDKRDSAKKKRKKFRRSLTKFTLLKFLNPPMAMNNG